MSTDLRRRLTEGADNIHSIGAGRAADLLREAASALQEDLMTEDECRDRESAKISEESDAILRATQVRLPSGKDVAFSLPAQTKSGTKFRFKRGGEDGRDLHIEVLAMEQDMGHG